MGSWHTSLRALVSGLALLSAGSVWAGTCRDDVVHIRGADRDDLTFNVEIADDPQEHAQGLMFRRSMDADAGMLFIYDRPQRVSFWMRNTLIELDMIFISPEGVIARVHHRAQPLDETPVSGGRNRLAVLEINGGLAETLGIRPGDQIRHPAFGAKAAWPC